MDSGIYQLTYANGATYVGQSKHIQTRWKQHFDKLEKGKAAKEMQDAFRASGNSYPETKVLLYCHQDMLDYYEGFFINSLHPPLNTQIPPYLSEREKEILVDHANNGNAVYSVVNLIEVLNKFSKQIADQQNGETQLQKDMKVLEAEYEELSATWNRRARRDNWAKREYRKAVDGYKHLQRVNQTLERELEVLRTWKTRVEGASWWDRLFGNW